MSSSSNNGTRPALRTRLQASINHRFTETMNIIAIHRENIQKIESELQKAKKYKQEIAEETSSFFYPKALVMRISSLEYQLRENQRDIERLKKSLEFPDI